MNRKYPVSRIQSGRSFICLVIVALSFLSQAQIIPEENATLNFTQVLFEIPEVPGASDYVFQVTEAGRDFEKPFITRHDKSQVTVLEGFDFGKAYQWKVSVYDEQMVVIKETDVYHFRIGTSDFINSDLNRFKIIKDSPGEYKDGLIFLDYSGVAIDRAGKPVWYLPELPGVDVQHERFRDLKMSSAGTITFNAMRLCREISIDGTTLWETPGDSGLVSEADREFYHHEFTRLKSGNFVALGKRYREKELVIGDQKVNRIPISVIIEYNRNGDTVWTWNSDSYIQDSDLQTVGQKVLMGNTFGHMNSTFFNEASGEVYACFRDLNTILVIDKKTRKVIRSYGDKIPSDNTDQAIGFFHKQHAPVLMENNKIIVFDNGDQGRNTVSRLVVFTQVDSSRIDWVFPCNFDTLLPSFSPRMGNVHPLDTAHFLVNMGKVARLFEVSLDNRIIWHCLPERWNPEAATWKPQSNYRLAYSSSLFPCYFSFALKQANTGGEKILALVNEGSEDDSYTIRFIPANAKRKKQTISLESSSVKAGAVFEIGLDRLHGKIWRKGFTVEVQSKTNKQLIKKSKYSW